MPALAAIILRTVGGTPASLSHPTVTAWCTNRAHPFRTLSSSSSGVGAAESLPVGRATPLLTFKGSGRRRGRGRGFAVAAAGRAAALGLTRGLGKSRAVLRLAMGVSRRICLGVGRLVASGASRGPSLAAPTILDGSRTTIEEQRMRGVFYEPRCRHRGLRVYRGTPLSLLREALNRAGYEMSVVAPSTSDEDALDATADEMQAAGRRLADQLLDAYRAASGQAPQIWVTGGLGSHAPDWVGVRVSRELGIPYVLVEPQIGEGTEASATAEEERSVTGRVPGGGRHRHHADPVSPQPGDTGERIPAD